MPFSLKPGTHNGVSHTLLKSRIDFAGEWYNPPSSVTDYYPIITGSSYQPYIVQGDHVSAYSYDRSGMSVTVNSPDITRSVTRNYGHTYQDITRYNDGIPSWWSPGPVRLNSDEDRDNAANMANVKALDGLGGKNKEQLLVDLVESKKTFSMFYNAAMEMARALHALKRGDVGYLKRAAKLAADGSTAANTYLEYRYGWKPLVSSIYGYQEALKKDWSFNHAIASSGYGSWSKEQTSHFYNYEVKSTSKGSVRTTYTARIERGELAHADSIGAINPVSMVWELIPYSFVIDWFVPVGDVLEAYSSIAGLMDVQGYTSSLGEEIHHWKNSDVSSPVSDTGSYYEVQSSGAWTEKYYGFTRRAHGYSPPQIYADPDPFGGRKSSRGWAAAALIRQLLR